MSADMSGVVKYMFYHGPFEVKMAENGVDLSDFYNEEVDVPDPQTWSFSQFKEHLTERLCLDTDAYTVGVHALWTQSRSNAYLYLRPIESDSKWVRWLEGCARRVWMPHALLLPVLKDGNAPEGEPTEGDDANDYNQISAEMNYSQSNYSQSGAGGGGYESGQSSQVGEGNADDYYSAEADADEVDGHMQNQMDNEDTYAEDGHDHSSDESDAEENAHAEPIPDAWNQDFSSVMTDRKSVV